MPYCSRHRPPIAWRDKAVTRHVLFLNWRDLTHPEGGGCERYVEMLARDLAAQGDRITLHCAGHPGAVREEIRDGVRIVRRGGRFTVYPYGLLAVRRHRPDVVVDVQNGIPFFSPLVHRSVVVLVHHVSRDQWFGTFGRTVARVGWWLESTVCPRLYRKARYVAVSGPTRDDLVAFGIDPGRVTTVYNPTEPVPAVPPSGFGEHCLCVIARMVPHKQTHHAVRVLARLTPDFPSLRLRIIGDGPERPVVDSLAHELGVQDRVELLGPIDDAAKHRVLAGSTVLLCPSAKEGWARVVMEAAGHGVPTVAYRHSGGLTESIRDGETGLLADDLEELTKQTRWLLEHPQLRTAMGEAARAYAASFTPQRAVADFSAVLGSM
jgi:glycosyltransferase involved in cell wall biosynthesis